MISVIVPIYNAQNSIKKCIESLLNQTKQELEIILVNDGSTDNTEEIIKTFNDPRIKYFKNENQGIGKTRNFGIEKASSEYIMFLDSDDYFKEDACEKLYNKITNDNLDVVVFDYFKVKGKEISEYRFSSFDNASLRDNPKLLNIINLGPCNKIYRTNLIKNNNIRFVENLKYEDAPFVAEAINRANKVGKLDECLYYYVIHDNSETTVRDERIFDILKIVDIIRNNFKDDDYIKEELDYLTISILMNYNIQQRVQKSNLGSKFIDESFEYLEKNIPNYKKNKYFRDRGLLKSIIEKNKNISKLYCNLYRRVHGINKQN